MTKVNTENIICKGKLAKSSYYDILSVTQSSNQVSNDNQNRDIESENYYQQQQQQQLESQTQQEWTNNSNIEVSSCVFSPDGTYLAWSCGYGLIKIMKWKNDFYEKDSLSDQANEAEKRMLLKVNDMVEIDCGGIVTSLAFGSSKSFVIHSRKLHRPNVYTRFNYDENMLILAVGLQSGKIRIYDVLKNKFLFILFDHTDFVSEMKFTRDGSFLLASVSKDQTIKLWNMMDDGNMYKSLKAHTSLVCSVDWSPTASLLCSVGSGRQAFIWDTEKYSIKHTLKGHLHDVSTCQFSPDGSVLATGSYDTKIFLWNPYNGNLIKQFFHLIPPPSLIYAGGYNGAYVKGLTFSSHGDHLVSLCDDKKIRIWSMIAKSCNLIAEGVHKDGKVIAYSSESRKIIVGTKNGHLEVYETMVIIPRLVDICRKIVNQFIDRNSIEKLYLPSELKSFLQYENITD